MKVKTLEELVNEGALEGKRVFIRADMNVPAMQKATLLMTIA